MALPRFISSRFLLPLSMPQRSISLLAGLLLVGYEQAREAKNSYKAVANIAVMQAAAEALKCDALSKP